MDLEADLNELMERLALCTRPLPKLTVSLWVGENRVLPNVDAIVARVGENHRGFAITATLAPPGSAMRAL